MCTISSQKTDRVDLKTEIEHSKINSSKAEQYIVFIPR